MKHLKKVEIPVIKNNIEEYNIYYYSTLDGKVEVLERNKNVWFINICYDVDLNIDQGEHLLKEGTLEEMLIEGEKLYQLILEHEK